MTYRVAERPVWYARDKHEGPWRPAWLYPEDTIIVNKKTGRAWKCVTLWYKDEYFGKYWDQQYNWKG